MLGCTCESGPASAHSDDGHGNWTWYCPVHYVDNVNVGSGDQLRSIATQRPPRRLGSYGLPAKARASLFLLRVEPVYGPKPIQVPLRTMYPKARGLH